MKKRLLLLMLCPALAWGLPARARAQDGAEEKMGTVTIQYMDFASSGNGTKPIEGAMFSFYPIDRKKGQPHATPYVTLKTDASGVLEARLPEGEYKVRQEENEVRYRTSDFLIRIPMKNDQGVLTDEIEAVPKAEPITESTTSSEAPSPTEEVTSEPSKQETPAATPMPSPEVTASPTPGSKGSTPPAQKAPVSKHSSKPVKTGRVKTDDEGLYPAAAAVVVAAGGLGAVMLISRKRQRKGDEKS